MYEDPQIDLIMNHEKPGRALQPFYLSPSLSALSLFLYAPLP